ncbi:MAG: riboflavin synthase [Actinomycetota bacterium]
MFTGIVLETGIIKRARGKGVVEFEIEAKGISSELRRGDSVAVNGVCLTTTGLARRRFRTEAIPETLALTTLGRIEKGARVNLELAVRLTDRLGGHMVQGHVDGLAELVRLEEEEGARRLWFHAAEGVLKYMVPKGSVTLDGVSLTLVEVGRTTFQVAIIPHTLDVTTLGRLKPGMHVNVEVDILAKYVERLLEGRS